MKNFFKDKRNILFLVLFIILLCLLGQRSFIALIHNSFAIRNLAKKSALLDEQYKNLTKEYEEILSGKTNYIEDNARIKYNMANPNEIEFRIKK